MKTFRVTVTLRGPVLTRGTTLGAFGVDTVVARDGQGRLVLPGSHVLGKVREAMRQLHLAAEGSPPWGGDWLEKWFAGRADEEMGVRRRRIHFDDFVAVDPGPDAGERTRVAIDPVLGRALDAALQVYEAPLGAGQTVKFTGAMHVLADNDEAGRVELAVRAAFNWMTQLGGLRTIGFGRIQEATVEPAERGRSEAENDGASERRCLVLRFRGPFLIAARRAAENTYSGDDVVPGGVVKGALAAMITDGDRSGEATDRTAPRYAALARHLHAISVSHLFPASLQVDEQTDLQIATDGAVGGNLRLQRPIVAPHSLGITRAVHPSYQQLRDYAFAGRDAAERTLAIFSPDWKPAERALVRRVLPWPDVAREVRVRTAIDPQSRAAKAEQLFALEMVRPDGHVWMGTIDLLRVPEDERQQVVAELEQVLNGEIVGLGRSETSAQALLLAAPPHQPLKLADDDRHVIVLQTPALLRHPDVGAGDPVEALKRVYARSIEELLDRTVTLERCIVRERLAGAEFMARRYFRNRPYRPWLLTEAGSTFVLSAKGDKDRARQTLEMVRRAGLGLSSAVRRAYGYPDGATASLWRDCPYLPENGYGEIIVDHPVHRQFAVGTEAA